MVSRSPIFRVTLFILLAAMPVALFGANEIGRIRGGGESIQWTTDVSGHAKIMLRVADPAGNVTELEFPAGKPLSFSLRDLAGKVVDGAYRYEMYVVPVVSPGLAKQLAQARENNDDAAAEKLMKAAGLDQTRVQSGGFLVVNSSIVNTEDAEKDADDTALNQQAAVGPSAGPSTPSKPELTPITMDQVIPDDLIVQGSACVGLDCVNNENFGFDTIRLKENNLRIHFDDTSTQAGFPANDWRLIANDSASGGSSKFSIEDSTSSKTPFTITAGASTNSIFADSTGRIGFRTSTPVLDLHVNTSNTPAIRLEQNNSGGFTAQTWDIGANEANFFVRDVTSGSTLPLRIRPGAPTSSLDISADGTVGINDASPNENAKLDVNGAIRLPGITNPTTDSGAWQWNESGVGYVFQSGGLIRFRTGATTQNRLVVTTGGDVGINCTTPTADFVIFGTPDCSGAGSTINAGATQFTMTSSREIKENLEPVAVPDLLDRIEKVGIYKYDFKKGPKDKVGMMAEDFHTVFGRGSDKVIDGNEVQMALWMAVQQLSAQNKELKERLNELESKVTKQN